jgi:putative transposase
MCAALELPRSVYYYLRKQTIAQTVDPLASVVISAFEANRGNYGARKLKETILQEFGIRLSRRHIRQIMKANNLFSAYTVKRFKAHKDPVNRDPIANVVDRQFDNREKHEVVVSDLTYINVMGSWVYLCTLIDLFNREIIGWSIGPKKDATLVKQAFWNATIPLTEIEVFHTDRGSEFKNETIDEVLKGFQIQRSLSKPGCPYDNAVAETTYKAIKTEFVKKRRFESIEQLRTEFFDYVNWYNKFRLHGALKYKSPVQYRLSLSI